MIHHVTRATRILLVGSLIALALGLTAIRLSLSALENYRTELESHIAALIGAPVEIGRFKTKMRAFTPELVLSEINIPEDVHSDRQQPSALKVDEIRLHIDLWNALWTRQLWESSWITIVGADLTVKREANGSLAIAGLSAGDSSERPLWLLQGRRFELLHSRLTWQDEQLGTQPIAFERVDLVVKNNGDRHRLHLLTTLPENLGDSLRVSMELNGNFFETNTIDGQLFLESRNARLSNWNSWISGVTFKDGIGNTQLWATWRHGRLIEAVGDIALQNLKLTFNGKEDFSAARIDSLVKWSTRNHRWQVDVARLTVQDRRREWPEMQFSLAAEQNDDESLRSIALAAKHLNLSNISALLTAPGLLPAEHAQRLSTLHLKGNFDDFSLFVDLDRSAFWVDGVFSGLGFDGFESVPGFAGVSGRIRGNDRQGHLELATVNATMAPAGQFRQALPVERLQGRLDWRQTPEQWVVSGKQLQLDVPGTPTLSRLTVTVPKNESSPVLDLQSTFTVADISQVKHYLPVASIGSDAVAWLDRAFISGRVTRGGLLISGALDDFPFTQHQGVFQVLFDVAGMTLSYDPEWPHLTEVEATALFYGESLTVDVRQAKTAACSVKHAEITIPSLGDDAHLKVDGVAEGSIDGVLDFLQQTPIGSSVGALRTAILPQGSTSVRLGLDIPLVAPEPAKVDGAAQLDNASLRVRSFDLPVDRIDGALKFNENGLYAEGIRAETLGSPITVDIDSDDSQTVVKVAGSATVEALQNQFKLPWWHVANGHTTYRLELELPVDEARSPVLTINTGLEGIALDLPEDLAKTPETTRPLSLIFNLGDDSLLPVRLNYDHLLNAAFKIDIRQQTLQSGHFLLGKDAAEYPHDPIVKLEAQRKTMNLEQWLGFMQSQSAGEGEPMPIHEIQLSTQQLLNNFVDLGPLNIKLSRQQAFWVGSIDSTAASGELQIPIDRTQDDKIKLSMRLIDLSVLNRIQLNETPEQPSQTIPLFEIDSDKVIWRSVDLGRLELQTERIADGLHFNRIQLTGKNKTLSMSGSWRHDGKQTQTTLKGSLDGRQFGRLLNELGLYESMKEAHIAAKFDLHWQAAPYAFSLARLNGNLEVDLTDGRLLSIEPGLGRVLGLLAFSQWLKRLQLDFSDIYKEGLTFNSIEGRISLSDGIASTDNLKVDAIPATIMLSGTADLTERTLDQQVRVVPKSSDAVPIAGTIVGRLAGLIAQAVSDDYQEGFFFGSQYQVKGSWEQPDIIALHENDGLFKKTWQGLTDFPWTEK